MPLERREIELGGLTFEVDAAGPGDGPLVILLHGFPQSNYAWRHELPALAEAGYLAMAPNQRGYSPGARPLEVAGYAIEHLVGDIFALADHAGRERFHLVGHDWGGALGWLAAERAPERLRSLSILSRPHPNAFARALAETEDQVKRSGHHKTLLPAEAAAGLLANGAEKLRAVYRRHNVPDGDVEAYLATLGDEAALNAAINWYRAGAGRATAGADGKAAGIAPTTVPTLYIWGDQDYPVSPQAAAWTADHVAADYTFVNLDGIGHFITDEKPGAVKGPLLEHLARWRE